MPFPNQQCLGCGKQRFRLKAFKRLDQQVLFALKKKLGLLKWDKAKVPVFTTEESRDSQAA